MNNRTLTRGGFVGAALLWSCLQACSGRAIDLDQASGTVSAGAGGDDTVLLKLKIVSDILVDDTRLYWIADDGSVKGCLKDNCAHSLTNYANARANSNLTRGGRQSRLVAATCIGSRARTPSILA
jgi:hypothetical protein